MARSVRPEELEPLLAAIAPSGSFVEVTLMDTGAFHVLVRRTDGPIVVMQGRPVQNEFGLTPDIRGEDAGFDDGHPIVMSNYDEAIQALFAAVAARAQES